MNGIEHALIDWDDPDDSDGNTAHIAEHGLAPDEVKSVLRNGGLPHSVSESTGRPIVFGSTHTGRFIVVVYEILNRHDPLILRPITAYEVPEPS